MPVLSSQLCFRNQLIKTDIFLNTFHWVCYFDFKTTFALISLVKQMCGVYNAFETEGAINDESSYYILNQNGHKKRSAYGLTSWTQNQNIIFMLWKGIHVKLNVVFSVDFMF